MGKIFLVLFWLLLVFKNCMKKCPRHDFSFCFCFCFFFLIREKTPRKAYECDREKNNYKIKVLLQWPMSAIAKSK